MNWTLRRRAGASWVGVVVVCGVDNDTVDKDGVVVGFLRMDSMEGPEKKARRRKNKVNRGPNEHKNKGLSGMLNHDENATID